MQATLATDVRQHWSEFFDAVVREKPQAVKRNRDLALFIALPHMKEILKNYRFTLEVEVEENGTYNGSLKEVDIMWYANSLNELKQVLAQHLMEYSQTYMDEFNLYFNAPNRKHHLPHVLHVLIQDSLDDVVQLINGDLERV